MKTGHIIISTTFSQKHTKKKKKKVHDKKYAHILLLKAFTKTAVAS